MWVRVVRKFGGTSSKWRDNPTLHKIREKLSIEPTGTVVRVLTSFKREVHALLDPEEERRRKKEEKALRKKLEKENVSDSSAVMVIEQPKTQWEQTRERFAKTEAFQKVEKIVDSVKQTKVFQKTQEIKAKISEKREDFDEYVETTQNPMVLAARETVDSITAPTDTSLALEEIHYMDPEFNLTELLEELEYDMIPEVVKAYLKADTAYMETLCEGHALRAIMGEFIQRQTLGHRYDETILDISHVSFQDASFTTEDDVPVIQVTFMVQHVHCTRDLSGNVIDGSDSQIRTTHFAWVIRRDFESITEFDWKIVDFQAQGVAGYII